MSVKTRSGSKWTAGGNQLHVIHAVECCTTIKPKKRDRNIMRIENSVELLHQLLCQVAKYAGK